jgi:ferric-dicitrate binding protein FerR (iron transport regulator)
MDNKFLKYFDPEISLEEKEALLKEIYASPALKEEFETHLKAWSFSALSGAELENVDLDKEYSIFNTRLNSKETDIDINSGENMVPLRVVIQYAALILLLIGLGTLGYFSFKPKQQIAFNEITTQTGEKAQVTLSDGTKIWLNASSKLLYPSKLDEKEVHVYLQGEAYFDVKHNENRLFQVHAADLNIKVLGTAFNVKSYPEERIVETTLVRGKVRIEGKSSPQKNFVILSPNQKASYIGSNSKLIVTQSNSRNIQDRSDDLVQVKTIASKANATVVLSNNVNIKFETSWKDGKLEFVDEQFSSLTVKMERWFGVKIDIKDPKLENVRYTGSFEKETIEQALSALSLTLPFKFKIFKDSVTITNN